MSSSFFERDFDIKEYVNKRALEIQSLPDRILYKEMAEAFMVNLFALQRKEHQDLVQRVLDEVKSVDDGYDVSIGIIERQYYDETDTFMYPIINSNLPITTDDLSTAISKGEKYFLQNVYLKDIYQNVNIFKKENRYFDGIIKTTDGEYHASFIVEFDDRYLKKIKGLNQIFHTNSKKWSTVCTAYLMRIFSVSVDSVIGENISGEFIEFNVNFSEYQSNIILDIIPLWNISTLDEKTSAFPIPVNGGTKYEHYVLLTKFRKESKCLVGNSDINISYISNKKSNLIITCNESSPQKWLFYEIHKNVKQQEYKYPILSNAQKNSLTGDLMSVFNSKINTRAEICRVIHSLPYDDKLIYHSSSIQNSCANEETYNMDDFVIDELREESNKSTLILTFSTKTEEEYLIYDFMSFIVTQVQAVMPQYHCVGKLV